jgi:hypothetical protein
MRTDEVHVLNTAEVHRAATLTHSTIDQRPTWLTRWLTQLHADGRLTQLDDHAVLTAVAEIAQYRDRWQITSPDPTGPQPPQQTEQFALWQQAAKIAGLTHTAPPTPSIDIASQR